MKKLDFDLSTFLPYLLNQAAEATSREFSQTYRAEYQMTRTQWRVMANLGQFGAMTATKICKITGEEKTRVSRAVFALEQKQWLSRKGLSSDRRAEQLDLTAKGRTVYRKLGEAALQNDEAIRKRIGKDAADSLVQVLTELASTMSEKQ